MGKKIAAEMEAQRDIFTDGAIERGIDPAKATEVFDLMAKFADYGFNKSPCRRLCAGRLPDRLAEGQPPGGVHRRLHEPGDQQHRPAGRAEAGSRTRRRSRILPPDINRSGADFSVERLRRRQAGDPLRAGRGEEGRLGGDGSGGRRRAATRRSPISPISPPASIRGSSTACRSRTWCAPAPSIGWTPTAPACSPAPKRSCAARRRDQEEKASGQIGLFGGVASKPEPLRLPDMPDWPPLERLAFEAEAIGFHLTAHPLDAYAQALRRLA